MALLLFLWCFSYHLSDFTDKEKAAISTQPDTNAKSESMERRRKKRHGGHMQVENPAKVNWSNRACYIPVMTNHATSKSDNQYRELLYTWKIYMLYHWDDHTINLCILMVTFFNALWPRRSFSANNKGALALCLHNSTVCFGRTMYIIICGDQNAF